MIMNCWVLVMKILYRFVFNRMPSWMVSTKINCRQVPLLPCSSAMTALKRLLSAQNSWAGRGEKSGRQCPWDAFSVCNGPGAWFVGACFGILLEWFIALILWWWWVWTVTQKVGKLSRWTAHWSFSDVRNPGLDPVLDQGFLWGASNLSSHITYPIRDRIPTGYVCIYYAWIY